MFFESLTYLFNLEYFGKWKIEDNLLYMKREGEKWGSFKYRLYQDSLVIIDREWLMTFVKYIKGMEK